MDRRDGGRAKLARIWVLVLTLGMAAVLAFFYGHVLRAPNRVLLAGWGDGLNSYFAYVWHVERDASLLHYSGAGFPYGELVFYTPGHPLLSWTLQLLPFLAPIKVGVLNLSLLLGLILCSWSVYGIFLRFDVAAWAAATGAFGIAILQPQLFRLGGHLSLAHSWMIPLGWYLLLRTRASARWIPWALATMLLVLGCFLTHPYIGLMIVFFFGGYYTLLLLFRGRPAVRTWRTYGELALVAVMPVIVFVALVRASDIETDRPVTPIQSPEYVTRLESLIVPTYPPLRALLDVFFKIRGPEWETWCYIGLSSLLMLAIAAGVEIKRWASSAGTGSQWDDLNLYFGSGLLVLLFAMGLWQRWLSGYVPMLLQFRATGRFAWIFFYACTVFCTVRAYQYLVISASIRRATAIPIFLMVVGFYAVEGWSYHVWASAFVGHAPNVFNASQLDGELVQLVRATGESSAAAIIPLPYVHVGSELYVMETTPKLLSVAFPLAYHSAVPLMAGLTNRTSLRRTRELMALLAPTAFPKSLADYVPRDAVFVLLWSGEPLTADEQQLWDRGTPLFANRLASLKTMAASELFRSDRKQLRREFEALKGIPPNRGDWLLRAADAADLARVRTAADRDTIASTAREYTTLFELEPGALDSKRTYEISFIFHSIDRTAVNIDVIVEHERPGGGGSVWAEHRTLRAMPMQLENGMIARLVFRPTHPERAYKIFLKGLNDSDARFAVDHVLLRPLDVNAWRKGTWDGTATVFWNNIPVGRAGR